jgi:hypothetical protein
MILCFQKKKVASQTVSEKRIKFYWGMRSKSQPKQVAAFLGVVIMETILAISLSRVGTGKKTAGVIMARSGRAASMGGGGRAGMGRRAEGRRLGILGMFLAQG